MFFWGRGAPSNGVAGSGPVTVRGPEAAPPLLSRGHIDGVGAPPFALGPFACRARSPPCSSLPLPLRSASLPGSSGTPPAVRPRRAWGYPWGVLRQQRQRRTGGPGRERARTVREGGSRTRTSSEVAHARES
jgi:hypothetical protein